MQQILQKKSWCLVRNGWFNDRSDREGKRACGGVGETKQFHNVSVLKTLGIHVCNYLLSKMQTPLMLHSSHQTLSVLKISEALNERLNTDSSKYT